MNNAELKSQLLVSLLLSAIIVASATGTEVKLRERVVPKSSVVRLGDVAEIVTADRQLARKLAVVPLMPTPAPETERFLQKHEVADMIAASGVDLAEIQLDGATRVAVSGRNLVQPASFEEATTTASNSPASQPDPNKTASNTNNLHAAILAGEKTSAPQQLSDEELAAAKSRLEQVVAEYLQSKCGKVGRIDLNFTDRQLAQAASATSALTCEGGSDPWTGRQKLTLSFMSADGAVHLPTSADIAEPAAPVVVALRPVGRGSIVTAADVEVHMMEPSAKTAGKRAVFESVEKLIGMEAKQALQQGEVVFADQLQSPVVVKRGDLITVVSQTSGIRVRTSARALQDGSTGELIQVESLELKQHYDARVTGLREAAVFAATRLSAPQKPEQLQTARRLTPQK